MDGITYRTAQHCSRFQVRMDDTIFGHPWYLKYVREGRYEWTASSLWGKDFSLATAQAHIRALEAGSDKDWPAYHDHWKNYFIEIGVIKEANA